MDAIHTKLAHLSDDVLELIKDVATRLNAGQEVVIPEKLKEIGIPLLVIALGAVTTIGVKSILNLLLGSSSDYSVPTPARVKSGVPVNLTVNFDNESHAFTISTDDFTNESKRSKGLTLKSFRFALSRFLTPKILAKRNKAASATSLIDPTSFVIRLNDEELTDEDKYLVDFGVRENGELDVELRRHAPEKQDEVSQALEELLDEKNEAKAGRKRIRNKNKKKSGKGKNKKNYKKNANSNNNEDDEDGSDDADYDFPAPIVKPLTPREQIDKVLDTLQKELVPMIDKFVEDTPKNKTEREDEHHRISELMLLKMFAMDEIDASDPEIRQYRKDAINKMHKYLAKVDEVKNNYGK